MLCSVVAMERLCAGSVNATLEGDDTDCRTGVRYAIEWHHFLCCRFGESCQCDASGQVGGTTVQCP